MQPLRRIELEGTPAAMGRKYGEALQLEIETLYQRRLQNALEQAKGLGNALASEEQLLEVAAACCEATAAFDPDGFSELEGIALGSGLSVEQVMAMNGLTDLRDILAWSTSGEVEGCTAVIVPPVRSNSGQVICGQTWDLATDNAPHVLAVSRRPDRTPATIGVTTDGCLSLMGCSSEGVAIGTTNLRTRDARPGVPYLSLIHRALACADAREAAACIEDAARAGAHFFYISDSEGESIALECTATRSRRRQVSERVFVQTNHCQAPGHQGIEGATPQRSSRARQRRMEELVATRPDGLGAAELKGFFEDSDGAELAIRRDDFDGISTNAAVIMEPSEARMLACGGLPRSGGWEILSH